MLHLKMCLIIQLDSVTNLHPVLFYCFRTFEWEEIKLLALEIRQVNSPLLAFLLNHILIEILHIILHGDFTEFVSEVLHLIHSIHFLEEVSFFTSFQMFLV